MSLPRRFSSQRGPEASHNLLRTLRAHFGLTQDWLSGFLQVPRTAISMEESVGRGLPGAAYRALEPLLLALPAPEGPAPEPPDQPTAAGLAAAQPTLADRRTLLGLEHYRLTRQLQKVRIRLRQARLRQQALPGLLAALAPAPADERPRRYLGYWAADLPDQLRDDEATLLVLELRLRVLAFEQAELERLLGA